MVDICFLAGKKYFFGSGLQFTLENPIISPVKLWQLKYSRLFIVT